MLLGMKNSVLCCLLLTVAHRLKNEKHQGRSFSPAFPASPEHWEDMGKMCKCMHQRRRMPNHGGDATLHPV